MRCKSCRNTRRRNRSDRRGSMFPQVLIYLTLLSAVMSLCGIALHTALKSDRTDRQVVLLMESLRRMDRQLRSDHRSGTSQVVSDQELRINLHEGNSVVEWTVDRGIVARRESGNETLIHQERYVFPAGSRVEFVAQPSGEVIVRIHEPSPLIVHAQAAHGGAMPAKPSSGAKQPVGVLMSAKAAIEIQLPAMSQRSRL